MPTIVHSLRSHYIQIVGGFGACLAGRATQQLHKLQDKATKCIFAGYNNERKGHRLFQPTLGKIIISRDVIFAENAAQPLVDCSKEPILDQPNAFNTLLQLSQNIVFEGN
mgnify:FL=1